MSSTLSLLINITHVMETNAKRNPPTFNVTDHYKFIPFVASSNETNEITKEKSVSYASLSGDEAAQFYKEIISTPSTSVACVNNARQKSCKLKKKESSSSASSKTSRLTIFHHAQNGNVEGIKDCLSNNIDVNVQDMFGWTPLMCATFEGHYDAVQYLLERGADLFIKNNQGLSAFDLAIQKNFRSIIELFKNGGAPDSSPISRNEVDEEEKFCDLCNVSYVGSVTKHEKSIAHLFSSQNHEVSTYYHIPENNKGFQIMLKKGWDKNKGLGINASGRKFPVKTILKTDRACIGIRTDTPKVTHFGSNDYNSVKSNIQPTLNMKREKRLKKLERNKIERRNRHLEIEFRRQFHYE